MLLLVLIMINILIYIVVYAKHHLFQIITKNLIIIQMPFVISAKNQCLYKTTEVSNLLYQKQKNCLEKDKKFKK